MSFKCIVFCFKNQILSFFFLKKKDIIVLVINVVLINCGLQ